MGLDSCTGFRQAKLDADQKFLSPIITFTYIIIFSIGGDVLLKLSDYNDYNDLRVGRGVDYLFYFKTVQDMSTWMK
jgi:hypothetical protein